MRWSCFMKKNGYCLKPRVLTLLKKTGLWNANIGNIPKSFWGECILTATYIINRLPSKVIGNKTPYEVIFDKKPDYDLMRVFGCLVYFKSNEPKGDKFEVRGRPGVFLGYLQGTKGYKVFDIENRKIMVSRDVKFHENHFPFNDKLIEIDNKDPFEVENRHKEDIEGYGLAQTENKEVLAENEDIGSNQNMNIEETESHEMDYPDQSTTALEPPSVQPLEKRNRTQLKHFADYEVMFPPSVDHAQTPPTQESSTVHPLSNFVSYKKFTTAHKAFLAAIDTNNEPKFFHQAVKDDRWKEAMKKEIQALKENGTWTLENLPEGKHAIDSKWVYKVKYKPNS
ncbi:putative RNA-directed DNA polymerase [Tanacetum coccineum]